MKLIRASLPLLLVSSLWLVDATAASDKPLIVKGKDAFEFSYKVTIPPIENEGKLWLPIASSDRFQKVELLGVTTHKPWRQTRDKEFRNRILTMNLVKADAGKTVEVRYRVERKEKSSYKAGKKEDVSRHLNPETLVPRNERLAKIAREAVKDAESELAKGKALYWHTLGRMAYDKSGTGWGRGDALYACDSRTGNCTDFHAYFIGLARAVGLPARFAIGFTIPADTDEGVIGGYHCWAEIYAGGKWHPVDISEADKHPELKDYYVGHHPANRFQFTLGRDLEVEPAPASGAMNYLVYPLVEADGKVVATEQEFRFKRLRAD